MCTAGQRVSLTITGPGETDRPIERQTDLQTYLSIEMQFYISVMFLGLPDKIHEKKTFIFAI